MEEQKNIERYAPAKLRLIVEGYDRQIDQFSKFLNGKRTPEEQASLAVMDKTMKLMKELPALIKARDDIAAIANGDASTADADEGQPERSAIQRKNSPAK